MPQVAAFSNDKLEPYLFPEDARVISVKFAASKTLVKGQLVAETAADGLWDDYATGGAGGLEIAKGVVVRSFVTDSAGKVYYGTSTATEHSEFELTALVYVAGTFKVSDLVGYDAGALADLYARELVSHTGDAIVRIP